MSNLLAQLTVDGFDDLAEMLEQVGQHGGLVPGYVKIPTSLIRRARVWSSEQGRVPTYGVCTILS